MTKKKEKGFWESFDNLFEKFDSMFESFSSKIDSEIAEIESGNNSVNTIGKNNVVISGSSSVKQRSIFGNSKSTIVQDGKKVVVETKNGTTTITVDGKEYVPKENK